MMDKEIKLLKDQIEILNKEKSKLKKLNSSQSRIINKIVNHDVLRKYIKEDELIYKIVEILEFCSFKVHRDTFKNFLKKEYTLKVDNMKGHELEAAAINLYRFKHVTINTIDKKLEELKYLRLIEFNDENYYIKATYLLITIINKEYKKINNSIKDENKLIIETEDKLFSYRFTLKNDYLTKNKELIDKFKVYNSIYTIDENIFVIGRRSTDDLASLKKRTFKMIMSDLVDTITLIDTDDNRYQELLELSEDNVFNLSKNVSDKTQIPIIIYLSKKIKIDSKYLGKLISSNFNNPILIIRY